ncbi:MAG TPA: (4Fe-4S)-binding protein [Flavobacterium sp.]|jgi:uncharacterized Fe-S cluster protein YjdI|nr:(4Fe-4S)-binding protein [Flavobacterium sp.]HQV34732.1 (4Fe-4S)-binding protein [Flavobacterium sp.]HQX02532.1 (4Fe-4S)-binding protein [Flavobacterium sp.]HRZ33206.1 (4Fe-4S)-binding protein [Flavobacterium sp.]HRZ74305.1 (4Fe-4S)-binding protein [Flavobacterium sp.]
METENTKKEYTNGEITVVWEAGKCIHSGNCVRNNSAVFQPKEKPWIKIDASSSEKIMETVNKCPSGALTFYRNK